MSQRAVDTVSGQLNIHLPFLLSHRSLVFEGRECALLKKTLILNLLGKLRVIIDTVWDNEIEAVDGWRFTWRSKIPEMQRRVRSFLQGVQNLVLSVTKFCGRGRIPCSACEGEENTEKTYWRRWYLNWVLKYLWASLSSFIKQDKWTRSTIYVLSLKRTLWLRKSYL